MNKLELQDYKIADFNINEITKHILENIVSLSKKKDSELKEIQQEQLTGNSTSRREFYRTIY